ncbi:PadR family transcriptional regulator [Rhodococcus olei]|uniref:PadR family transcriptional regulator n=1 Tax=Rhodococcus olei TaxID=2161675 RepID=A0ABP8P1F8_9NOCA
MSYPELPATAWAVLGMFTFGEKLTGNDLKRWADMSVRYFYWGPSLSQVYAELKRLEELDLVTSTVVSEPGVRARRVYEITRAGVDAIRAWSHSAPVELPVLKHGVVLRLWMGHLNDPEHLKTLVTEHIRNLGEIRDRAGAQAARSDREPAWAFSALSLRWAQRYFEAEMDLARGILEDIDSAAREFDRVEEFDEWGMPKPITPGSWRTRRTTDTDPGAES